MAPQKTFLALLALTPAGGTQTLFNIDIPSTLHRSGGYPHSASLFGSPLYGASVTQRMYYANSTLCEDTKASFQSPYVLLVDRGGCSFVSKARRAQSMGATALVAVDSRCVCGEECEPQQTCQATEPVLSDDGSGADVSIPAVMLHKQDGEALEAYYLCGALDGGECAKDWTPEKAVVQASLEYTVPNPDDRVEWELWTTSVDTASLDFLADVKDTVLALGQSQYFTPRMYTYNGSYYGCDSKAPVGGADLCGSLCTNGGKYCAPDPDGSLDEGISGAAVVAENLRRTCIWNLYGGAAAPAAAQGVGEPWWDYAGNFTHLCGTAEAFADSKCRSKAMKAAHVDEKAVENCVTASGGLDAGPNTLLDEVVKALEEENIVYVPECLVNGEPHYGRLTPSDVLATICQGYAHGSEPQPCDCVDIASPAAYERCLADGGGAPAPAAKRKEVEREGMPWYGVLLLVVAIVVVMLLAGLAYWKHTQKVMRDQVRGILAEYMPLDDLGTTAPDQGASFNIA